MCVCVCARALVHVRADRQRQRERERCKRRRATVVYVSIGDWLDVKGSGEMKEQFRVKQTLGWSITFVV